MSSDEEKPTLEELFDSRANAPGTWWWFGKNLFTAADLLAPYHAHGPNGGAHAIRLSAAVHGPVQHLRACALEAMLKALVVEDARPQLAREGRLKLDADLKSHDLVRIARAARLWELHPHEIAVLEKLTPFYELGRFPVAMTAADTYRNRQAWTPTDEVALKHLRDRLLRDHDGRIAFQQGQF